MNNHAMTSYELEKKMNLIQSMIDDAETDEKAEALEEEYDILADMYDEALEAEFEELEG